MKFLPLQDVVKLYYQYLHKAQLKYDILLLVCFISDTLTNLNSYTKMATILPKVLLVHIRSRKWLYITAPVCTTINFILIILYSCLIGLFLAKIIMVI